MPLAEEQRYVHDSARLLVAVIFAQRLAQRFMHSVDLFILKVEIPSHVAVRFNFFLTRPVAGVA